jgi:hypothetical protein
LFSFRSPDLILPLSSGDHIKFVRAGKHQVTSPSLSTY